MSAVPKLLRLQHEVSYLTPVREAGHSFLFTFDEEGFPVDDEVVSEYQFGYGAVHFFGKLDARGGRSSELVRLVHPVGTQFRRPGTVARFRVF